MIMKKYPKKKRDDFEIIDDYYEEEDDKLFRKTIDENYSDVNYEDFTKVHEHYDDEVEDYDDFQSKQTSHSSFSEPSVFSTIWTWFCRVGIFLAVVLCAYYITEGKFTDLLCYLFLLVGAFFFGYGFMFVFYKYKENR